VSAAAEAVRGTASRRTLDPGRQDSHVTALRARLVQLLGPVVEGAGLDLEDVDVTPAGRRSIVRVVVDRDGGVPLDDVAQVSRVVSDSLDGLDAAEPGLLGASFVLEVSSPGVDRPLTTPRHWRRSTGRLVRATLRDGGEVTGRVRSADGEADGAVLLDVDGDQRPLPYAELVQGSVQVEFARPADAKEKQP
jgi:ribosome maturation factor RimP